MSSFSNNTEITFLLLEGYDLKTFHFLGRKKISLGRVSSHNHPDLPSISPAVSREHGDFLFINDNWFFCDKGSLNGTFIRGKKVTAEPNGRMSPVILQQGDSLKIAHAESLDSPACCVFIFRDSYKSNWSFSRCKRNNISFGSKKNSDVLFTNTSKKQLYASVKKYDDCWLITSYNDDISINNLPLYSTESVVLMNYDCLNIQDNYFIFADNGFYYRDSSDFQINHNNFRWP